MKNSTIITEIDGQGQKIAAVVLEFGESIKPVDMQPDNYAVENQTVKELLVCSVPEWESCSGSSFRRKMGRRAV